jgi:hypothetical protein
MYLAFVATDRSHRSSDRAEREVEVERIGNGTGAAKIATGEWSFHSLGMRGLSRTTSHEAGCQFHFRL